MSIAHIIKHYTDVLSTYLLTFLSPYDVVPFCLLPSLATFAAVQHRAAHTVHVYGT